jgi:flagellar motor switch/type III secretory pathway protein FliN
MLLRESDLDEVLIRVENLVRDWISIWLSQDTPVRPDNIVAINGPADMCGIMMTVREFRVVDAGRSRVTYIGIASDRKLANLLLASPGDNAAVRLTAVEKSLVNAAVDDLAARILKSADGRAQNMDWSQANQNFCHHLQAGAGGVYCELLVGGVDISILLPPAALDCVWSRPPAASTAGETASVREALGKLQDSKIKIEAQLPAVEMTVGEFASLNLGDVIRLTTRADQYINVCVGDFPEPLRAHLGLVSGSPALQIIGVKPEQPDKRPN